MGWLIDLLPLPYTDAVVAVGAALLGLVAGTIGVYAVLRQRSLVGDALSHATLPGVCIAFLLTGAKDPSALLLGAGVAGLVGAVLMVGIEQSTRIPPDAAIGVVLSGCFALGIVLLTYIAGQGDASQAGLDKFLFGQAAGLQEQDVNLMLVLGGASLVVVLLGHRALKVALFDRGFAGSVGLPVRLLDLAMTALLVVAIVVGVRVVGAILMVAMLITPAVVARQLTSRLATMLAAAGLFGAAIGVTGALLSVALEVPTGPVIVLVGSCTVAVALLGAPERGVVARASRRRRARRRMQADGLLLDLETAMHAGAPPTLDELAATTQRTHRSLARGVARLTDAGLVARSDGRVVLNERGAAAAHALVQERALWSAWLEHGWRLGGDDVREPNPYDVRATLGDAQAEQLLQHAQGAGSDS